jgi:hypothetical protein
VIGQEKFCKVMQGLHNLLLVLSSECKNFMISWSLSLDITSPNPGVDRILFLENYAQRVEY